MRQQTVQLIALLFTLAISGVAAAAPSAERQNQLLYLLKQDCGSCHGMSLKGGLGPALLPHNLTGKPDGMLIQTVLDGRPGTAMPPWKGMLSHDDVRWLVDNLRKGVDDAP